MPVIEQMTKANVNFREALRANDILNEENSAVRQLLAMRWRGCDECYQWCLDRHLGSAEKKQELLKDLGETFRRVEKENGVPLGDFPDLARMQKHLVDADFSSFPKLNGSMLRNVDDMMRTDITNLMRKIPEEQTVRDSTVGSTDSLS